MLAALFGLALAPGGRRWFGHRWGSGSSGDCNGDCSPLPGSFSKRCFQIATSFASEGALGAVASRFQSRDSAIVALLAEITIVTRNFFHPKRGSIPACLASHSNLLCSRTRDCHVTFTFLYLIVTSPIRYPSGTFCFAATTLYDTTQVQEPCGNCLDIVFGMRDHMYVLL